MDVKHVNHIKLQKLSQSQAEPTTPKCVTPEKKNSGTNYSGEGWSFHSG